jgi:hypothetical protein
MFLEALRVNYLFSNGARDSPDAQNSDENPQAKERW